MARRDIRCAGFLTLLVGAWLTGCASSRTSSSSTKAPRLSRMPEGPASGSSGSVGTLFQVILNVRDMNGQLAFYRDVMGLRVVYTGGVEDPTSASFVRLDAGAGLLALHTGREGPHRRDEPRLSFLTASLLETRKRLLDAGVRVGEIRNPAPGVYVADFHDPEGNALHIESHGRDPRDLG